MLIFSSDKKRYVDIGTADNWICLYSTIVKRLGEKQEWRAALSFLKTGACSAGDGYETAKQLNLIRDKLSQLSPDQVVYDLNDPKRPVPWKDNLSPVITSCGNYFTTSDGKDMLFELVSILCYAQIMNVSIASLD